MRLKEFTNNIKYREVKVDSIILELVKFEDYIAELISNSECIYEDADKILNILENEYTSKFEDRIAILRMVNTKDEVEVINNAIREFKSDIGDIKAYLESLLSESDLKICFLWVYYKLHTTIFEDADKIIIPNGTKVILDTTDYECETLLSNEALKYKFNLIDYCASSDVSDKLYNDVVNTISQKTKFTKLIHTCPKQLILSKSVEVIDKNIFNWVRGLEEIKCYEHQLEEVSDALDHYKYMIDTHGDKMMTMINKSLNSRRTARERLHNVNKSAKLEDFKSIKITLLN